MAFTFGASAKNTTKAANNANNLLGQAYGSASNDLTSYGTAAKNTLAQGANNATGIISNAQTQALDTLTGYGDAAQQTYRDAASLYDPYTSAGSAATGMYSNALGLNGADGNSAATSAFQTSPGYDWQVSQATDAAARKASATGQLASGNTLDALTRLGSNLANQEYSGWLDRLSGLSSQGLSATSGQAGQMDQLGSLQNSLGQNRASIISNAGTKLADIGSTAAQQSAGIDTGTGQNLAQLLMSGAGVAGQNMLTSGKTADSANAANSQSILNGLGALTSFATAPVSSSSLLGRFGTA